MPSKRKFIYKTKRVKEEGRKENEKKKSRLLCHYKPKYYLKIFLSVHALALQADILHVDQKAQNIEQQNNNNNNKLY